MQFSNLMILVFVASSFANESDILNRQNNIQETGFQNVHHIEKRQAVEHCRDLKGYCQQWASRNYCSSRRYGPYMKKNCKASCNLCDHEQDLGVVATHPTSTKSSIQRQCVDQHKSCRAWKSRNYCNVSKYSDFMRKRCYKTCGWCKESQTVTKPSTTDKSSIAVDLKPASTQSTAISSTSLELTSVSEVKITFKPSTAPSSTTVMSTPEKQTTTASPDQLREGATTGVGESDAKIETEETLESATDKMTVTSPKTHETESSTAVSSIEESTNIIQPSPMSVTSTEQVIETGFTRKSIIDTTADALTSSTESTFGEPCKDYMQRCPTWLQYCGLSQYVEQACPLTCGICNLSKLEKSTTSQRLISADSTRTAGVELTYAVQKATASTQATPTVSLTDRTDSPKESGVSDYSIAQIGMIADSSVTDNGHETSKCEDVLESCPTYSNYCALSDYVRRACPLTCGTCTFPPNMDVSSLSSSTMTSTTAANDKYAKPTETRINEYDNAQVDNTADSTTTHTVTTGRDQESSNCEDTLESCVSLLEHCPHSRYIRFVCPFSCGTCSRPDRTGVNITHVTKEVTSPPPSIAAWKDTDEDIESTEVLLTEYIANSQVTVPASTTTQVTKTEDKQEAITCEDMLDRCPGFSKYCASSEYVRRGCPYTCGSCDKQVPASTNVATTSSVSTDSTTTSTAKSADRISTSTTPTDARWQILTTSSANDVGTSNGVMGTTRSDSATRTISLTTVSNQEPLASSTKAETKQDTAPNPRPTSLPKGSRTVASTTISRTVETPTADDASNLIVATVQTALETSSTTGLLKGCYDQLSICSSYDFSLCESSVTFRDYCPKHCGVCDAETTADSVAPPYTDPTNIECVDLSTNCAEYASFCTISDDVKKHCKLTCGVCRPEVTVSTCVDFSPDCTDMKYFCTGSDLSEEVRMQCPKTCNACTDITKSPESTSIASTTTASMTESEECQDFVDGCDKLVSFCETINEIKASCPLTCGECVAQSLPSSTAATSTIMDAKFVQPVTTISSTTTASNIVATPVIPAAFQNTSLAAASNEEASDTFSPGDEICVDNFSRCNEIAGRCNDPNYKKYLMLSCRKTCNFCDETYREPSQFSPTQWSSWSTCSVTCGQGEQIRRKVCVNPNLPCPGDAAIAVRGCMMQVCNEEKECRDYWPQSSCRKYLRKGGCSMPAVTGMCIKTCDLCPEQSSSASRTPVRGALSSWSTWGDCSAACGEGTMKRIRSCVPIRVDDEPVFCDGPPAEEKSCIAKPCTDEEKGDTCADRNKRCRAWFQKGYCNKTYTRYMRKHCAASCNTCGLWDDWSIWSNCNRNCGGGYQERSRNCSTVACKGLSSVRRSCNTDPCYQPDSPCSDSSTACFAIDPSQCGDSFYATLCKSTCGNCDTTVAPQVQCQDRDQRCPIVASASKCTDPRVSDLCPLSCNSCEQILPVSCEDKSAQCASVATAEECANPSVASVCPKSCGACSSVEQQCIDQTPKCVTFAMQGLCELDPVNAAINCKKSCGLCGNMRKTGLKECIDRSDKCQNYMLVSSCANELVAQQCQATCGLCESECVDREATCNILADTGYCNNPLITNTCPKSCGLCGKAAATSSCSDVSAMCTTYAALNMCSVSDVSSKCKKSCKKCPKVSQSSQCFDSNPQCTYYKSLNMCQNDDIAKQCKKSCGGCGCKDSFSSCPLLVNNLKCTSPIVQKFCQGSCGTCSGVATHENDCHDKIANCELIKSFGRCSDPVLGQRMCQKTCNMCGIRKKCEDKIPSCENAVLLGLCTRGSVADVCEKSCKLCDPANNPKLEEWDVETAVPVATIGCADEREEGCDELKEQGFCNQKYIRDSCNQTCRVCVPMNPGKVKVGKEVCMDATDECSLLTQGNTCTTDLRIRFWCAKSCGTCIRGLGKTKTLKCADNAEDCAGKKDQCHVLEVSQLCKHTCGHCDIEGSDPNPDTTAVDSAQECVDRMSGCLPESCSNDPYPLYVNAMCAQTCNLCETDVGISVTKEDYGPWGTWEACSKTCGRGKRVRRRLCKKNTQCSAASAPVDERYCAKDQCPDKKKSIEGGNCEDFHEDKCPDWARKGRCNMPVFKALMTVQCPHSCGLCNTTEKDAIDPSITVLGNWSECSVSCGGGTKSRKRGDAFDVESCNNEACPVGWSSWSVWSECSLTCGSGQMSRSRTCLGESDAESCDGPVDEISKCVLALICPDVGEWSNWTDTSCDVTCGSGKYTRTRFCYDGIPGDGGCVGNHTLVLDCELETCIGPWSEWENWSSCSESCGTGYKSKIRKREIPCKHNSTAIDSSAPTPQCHEEDEVFGMCNTQDCEEPSWGTWQAWTSCTVTCGGGSALRQRPCFHKDPNYCNNNTNAYEFGNCNTHACPSWSRWTEFINCSSSCGSGVASRLRTCEHGEMGSASCRWGDEIDAKLCEGPPCTTECQEEDLDAKGLRYRTSPGYHTNTTDGKNIPGRWCLKDDRVEQWIEVELGAKVSVAGITLSLIQEEKDREDLLHSAMPVIFVISHAPISTIRPEKYFLQKEAVVGPFTTEKSISLSWTPVTDNIWRISTKFRSTFDCLDITFKSCSYEGANEIDGSGAL